MPALKFILAAAAWGKVKANMTTTGKSWHFSELEAHGFHINIKHQHDRMENFILLINTNSSSGELGVDWSSLRSDRCHPEASYSHAFVCWVSIVWLPFIRVGWHLGTVEKLFLLERLFLWGRVLSIPGQETSIFLIQMSALRQLQSWCSGIGFHKCLVSNLICQPIIKCKINRSF